MNGPLSADRSPLKVTGQSGYRQVIWPSTHGAVNLGAVGIEPPHAFYLDTALDLPTIGPLLTQVGRYELDYAVLVKDYPVLAFTVALALTGDLTTTTMTLLDGR